MATDVSCSPESAGQCVVMAAASGGIQAFEQILSALNPPVPPIIVIQRIHPDYAGQFSERLQRVCSLSVKLAAEADQVAADQILVTPGDCHMQLVGYPPRARIRLCDDPQLGRYKPSFDVLFRSVAQIYGRDAVGILLTGMGRDGVDGCKAILAAGGLTLGQNQASSILYGPSKIALAEGALSAQFALDELPGILQNLPAYRDELETRSDRCRAP